ncbi:hypothetical protein MKS88_003532 [Plasmodium brasilianum]|uniref:Uncharacterized protein n=2 Tax=Plasmodium (Plasmodium) TaxID=418103 RepID=A0A1A8X8L2_PLAMA|nr:conserved Plasmodium protein, unknown function [Plasmodium malariae]KAI4837064.1 hypothetical protein MKS88_003532 [Plasmodium brasilianum]SBT01584.1 hypothetical protein PMALA_082420 [Plasmodium malariae]SCO92944.1 conserved Plasmodium protein, unknown function [Plasmodium malariae]
MDNSDIVILLKKNIKYNFVKNILLSSEKEKIDITYAINTVKLHIKRHVEINNNFVELFVKLILNMENLINMLGSHFEGTKKKNVSDYILNLSDFLKKKKEENYLKEKLNSVEKIIKSITLTLLNIDENKKILKELFLFFYLLIFKFSFDKTMFEKCLLKNENSTRYDSSGSSSRNQIKKELNANNTFTTDCVSLNKICEYECTHFFAKDTFVSKFYTKKDIQKIIKKYLLYDYYSTISYNNFNFFKEIKIFFFLIAVIYYIEKDLKLKREIYSLIQNEIYKNVQSIKKCTLIIQHNPYMCKIKKLSNILF